MAKRRATIDPNLFAKTDRQDVAPSQGQEGETLEPQTVKTTLYLSSAMMERLDLAQVTLKGIPGIKRRDVTMSGVIAAALELALQDLEDNKGESRLALVLSGKYEGTKA